METKARYILVGTFVLASIAALVGVLLWLGASEFAEEYAYYRVYFTGSVNGLGKGTEVHYNGIKVGQVSDLQFDPQDPKRVIATLQLDPTLKIRNDSVASVDSMSITGGAYVEITGGTQTAPLLTAKPGERYPVIPSKPSTLQQLAKTVPDLIDRLTVAANRVEDLLNDENRARFSGTLENLQSATAHLDTTLQAIDKTAGGFSTLTSHTDTAIQNTQAQIVQTLNEVGGMAAEMRRTAASVRELSKKLEEQPNSILFGTTRKGYVPK
jgi:phospholipid/cholesterol/gamma-HCH transport system substrate-binding protein